MLLACLSPQEVALTPIIHHLAPGRLCQLVWSLGQLGVRPNGQLVKSVFRGSSRCMSFLQGQDLCQLLQGLVLLKLKPHILWLDACCARVLQVKHGVNEFCVVIWACSDRCRARARLWPEACVIVVVSVAV